ncbi:hypothetical protein [Pseudotamlana carrageenivorans]|uniref:Uncharacterized protein n=1 Tax=Pseudotamlana carrageenivorans TaxID=2069432 RepID=A0A2I7SFU6_9FLAO|nr:hypothetical protein [Tamlana carrageenivorans]AUS04781.1 hypothetical protein C1A40_04510 [Tamlana carrageenivorans]
MKKLVLAVLIAVGVTFLVTYTYNQSQQETATESKIALNYITGWQDGYCEGWKFVTGEKCPTVPVAKQCDDCPNTYKSGFSMAFMAGIEAAQK